MAVHPLLTKQYAVNIITYGNRTFETIPVEYHAPVKDYIAKNFENYEIDSALVNGYITELDFTEIMTIKSELPPKTK